MPITPIPEERYEQVQRALRADTTKEPDVANIRAVMELGARTFFIYRGRAFIAEPVPYRAGLRLQVLYANLRHIALTLDDDTDAVPLYEKTISEVVQGIRGLARPSKMPRWLFRFWQPDSFQGATEREIGELLGFFLSLRTKSSVSIR